MRVDVSVRLMAALFVALCATACQNYSDDKVGGDEGGDEGVGTPIELLVGTPGRASLDLTDGRSVAWEKGDQVGLFHKVGNSFATKDAAYTAQYSGGISSFVGSAKWSGTAEDVHNLYIYYPRRGDEHSQDPANLAIGLTSTQKYDLKATSWSLSSDYMFAYAKVEEAAFGEVVTIPVLNHVFGILRLQITNNTGEEVVVGSVRIEAGQSNIAGTHHTDITGEVAVVNNISEGSKAITTTISNGSIGAGESADVCLVVSPGDYSADTFTVTITSDKGVHPTISFVGGNIAQGGRAVVSIGLRAIEPTVDVNELKVGGKFEGGIIFWIAEDKSSCKVLYPYGEKRAWSSGEYDVADAKNNIGRENVEAMKAYATTNGLIFESAFPAAAYCAAAGEGWYLPSSTELGDVFEAYNGTDKDSATQTNPDGITATEKAARAAFDAALLKAYPDGVVLNTQAADAAGDSAFSSNQTSAANATYFRWGKVLQNSGSKTSTARYARCVKRVDLTGDGSSNEQDDVLDQYVGLPTPSARKKYEPSLLTTYYQPIRVEYNSGSWTSADTRILPYLEGFTRTQTTSSYRGRTNKYGSSTTLPKQTATGRFYVKKIDGRWWIVDPEGYLHYERSVNSFRKGSSDRNATAFAERFESDADWVATTQKELASIGFHGTGAFSTNTRSSDVKGYKAVQTHNAAHPEAPLTLAPSFGFLGQFKSQNGYAYPNGNENTKAALVFYEGWAEFCKSYAKASSGVGPYLNDPNVLGIFSDNEINFGTSAAPQHLLQRVLTVSDKTNVAYKAAVSWCSANGVSTSSPTTDQCNRFAGYVAELYYKAVSEGLKAADPQMLYLGTRLHGQPKYNEYVVAAAGKWCDIISINYYGKWKPELDTWVPKWGAKRPFMVTEFYTKAQDSGLSNASGAGLLVKTQRDRAYAYQHFTLALLESPNCVGWHWFKYQDDDGDDNSGKPANKGIYDNYYNIIPDMGKYAKDVNIHVYDLIKFFDGGGK